MLFILWYHIMTTFIKVPTSSIIIMLTLSVRGHRDEYLVGIGQWLSYIPVLLDCRDKPESRGRQQQSTSASTLSVYGMWQPVCGCVGGCLWVCEGRRITTATRHNNNTKTRDPASQASHLAQIRALTDSSWNLKSGKPEFGKVRCPAARRHRLGKLTRSRRMCNERLKICLTSNSNGN